jgi:hypothetical protein
MDGKPAYGNVAGIGSTQRQVRKLISGPGLTTKSRLLSLPGLFATYLLDIPPLEGNST